MRTEIVHLKKNSSKHRENYYRFIKEVFPGADFREWFRGGFWTDKYQPFSLLDKGRIISNVSIAEMDLIIRGEKKKGVQFGAVGTLPDFRGKGFSRILMNYVLETYKNQADTFFLFANDSVLDFYPKFGFKGYRQYLFRIDGVSPSKKTTVKKLDIKNTNDYNLVRKQVNNTQSVTGIFGAENYSWITFWHILNFHSERLYYLEENKALFIKYEKNDQLHIFNVFYPKPFDLNSTFEKLIEDNKTNCVLLYFPPDKLNYSFNSMIEYQEAPLFVKGDFNPGTDKIKFPETAMT